ncbi:hypothetical protein LWI29_013402 [Acer saccharum]|uniref:Uncharacterized protein n=1 Tax=Acer saccharum TaxID=4024 RepID=A0AA39RDQ6_ACESA|nr:hypothetical protein LWI29_013402 [Acer saccharum]
MPHIKGYGEMRETLQTFPCGELPTFVGCFKVWRIIKKVLQNLKQREWKDENTLSSNCSPLMPEPAMLSSS